MRCYSHLSDDEREQIGLAKAVGHSIGAIAKAIGRPKSTVSREPCRNRLPSGRYSPLHAAGAYQLRRRGKTTISSAGTEIIDDTMKPGGIAGPQD
jgi:IS30 family transposase